LYICSLWSTTASYATAAARVSRCFIASSLLTSAFVHLWARSHFWLAELLLLASFFELSLTYFRHPDTPLSVHVGAVAGLLAWSFAALYWAGAAAARSTHLAARIVAHLSICGWLGYGMFYLSTYKDYVMGFALSVLSVCMCSSRCELPNVTLTLTSHRSRPASDQTWRAAAAAYPRFHGGRTPLRRLVGRQPSVPRGPRAAFARTNCQQGPRESPAAGVETKADSQYEAVRSTWRAGKGPDACCRLIVEQWEISGALVG
jgi:hypothetical protein